MMKVIIDLEKCVSNGRCYDFNPDVFESGSRASCVTCTETFNANRVFQHRRLPDYREVF